MKSLGPCLRYIHKTNALPSDDALETQAGTLSATAKRLTKRLKCDAEKFHSWKQVEHLPPFSSSTTTLASAPEGHIT